VVWVAQSSAPTAHEVAPAAAGANGA